MAQTWTGGHTGPVLCVQSAGAVAGSLLASGAEGGELTVWSPEGAPIAQLRLPGEDDVTCLAFSSTSTCPGLLYASHGEAVSVLDPRNLKQPVDSLSGIGEDEINGLSINDTGTMLAAGDDSGAVRIVELQTRKVVRTLRRHTNICASVAFRPQRPQSLVSAGLDMQVLLWNLQKTRPVWVVNLKDSQEQQEGSLGQQQDGSLGQTGQPRQQLFNPPLAHCVSVSSCGNLLACAAEDGRLHVMRVGVGSRLEQQVALEAHRQGASQAHFANFLSHPYWLVSAGNDGLVALWDLSTQGLPQEAKPRNSSRTSATAGRRRAKGKQSKARGQAGQRHQEAVGETETAGTGVCVDTGAGVCVDAGDGEAGVCVEPAGSEGKTGPALRFTHGEKINWVCPAHLQGRPSVVVADQSADLHVYPLSVL